MEDYFYLIIGGAAIGLIVLGLIKGFLGVKRRFGLGIALLAAILLISLAVAISLLTVVYLFPSCCSPV